MHTRGPWYWRSFVSSALTSSRTRWRAFGAVRPATCCAATRRAVTIDTAPPATPDTLHAVMTVDQSIPIGSNLFGFVGPARQCVDLDGDSGPWK